MQNLDLLHSLCFLKHLNLLHLSRQLTLPPPVSPPPLLLITPLSPPPPLLLLLSPLPPLSSSSHLPLSHLTFMSFLSLPFFLTSSPCHTPPLSPPHPEVILSAALSSLLPPLFPVPFLVWHIFSRRLQILPPFLLWFFVLLPILHLLHLFIPFPPIPPPVPPSTLLTPLLPPHLLHAPPLLLHLFLYPLLFPFSHLIVLLLPLCFPLPLHPLPFLLVSLHTSDVIVQFLRSTFRNSWNESNRPTYISGSEQILVPVWNLTRNNSNNREVLHI